MRRTWDTVNDLIGCKKSRSIEKIISGETVFETAPQKANAFNIYFSSIAQNLISNFTETRTLASVSPLAYMGPRSSNVMEFQFASPHEIEKCISSLKNSRSSINDVPVFIYKKFSSLISPIICDLFNSSVLEGVFPPRSR